MGIDFSKFSEDVQAKIKAALTDSKSPDKIDAEELRAMNLEQKIANQLMQELAGNSEYFGDGYFRAQNGNKNLILLDKPENNSFVPLSNDSINYYKTVYRNKDITQGMYNDGVLYLADSKGRLVKDDLNNYITEKLTILSKTEEADDISGDFEIIENEPPERTNRRFAVSLVRSMYGSVIQELQNVVAQMGVLDAGMWREMLGMGVQVIADLKKGQEAITATTKKKIERIEKERDNICDSLNELLDSPAEFESKFYQLVGKDYRDNAFDELREIQHNQESKDSKTKYRECVSRFKELYPDNKITENINSWEDSVDYQKTVDEIANIVVMFVMTGGIGKLFQGSVQMMAKNILLAAAKGDKKAVMTNFAKLAPEVQTIWKSVANKEYGVAFTQAVTPMVQSAETMGTWEGAKAFLNGLTNAEELSPQELIARTLNGIASGAEMGAIMGGLETAAIAPIMAKLTPFINKLSGASSEISELMRRGNGVVSMEKIMKTYTKANESLKGKIVKEGTHGFVALPVFTYGFAATDTAFHYDEEQFRKSLLEAATTDEEREAIKKMNSFDLRIEFAKNDFNNQVNGMLTIEGVGLIFRRIQAGRIATQATESPKVKDVVNANLREVKENGKTYYEIVSQTGTAFPLKVGNDVKTRFSNIEEATAAYSALCIEIYSQFGEVVTVEPEKDSDEALLSELQLSEWNDIIKDMPEGGKVQKTYGSNQNSGADVFLDSSGRVVQTVTYLNRQSNSISSIEQKEYGTNGKLAVNRTYENGALKVEEKYEYDSNGNEVKLTVTDGSGNVLGIRTFEYDANNKLIKRQDYESEHVVSETIYKPDGSQWEYIIDNDIMHIIDANGKHLVVHDYSKAKDGSLAAKNAATQAERRKAISDISSKEDVFRFFKDNFKVIDEQSSMFESLSEQQVNDLKEIMLLANEKLSPEEFNEFVINYAFVHRDYLDVIKTILTAPSTKEGVIDSQITDRFSYLTDVLYNKSKSLAELLNIRESSKNPVLQNMDNILYIATYLHDQFFNEVIDYKDINGDYLIDSKNIDIFREERFVDILRSCPNARTKEMVNMLLALPKSVIWFDGCHGLVSIAEEEVFIKKDITPQEAKLAIFKSRANEIAESYKPDKSQYTDDKEYQTDLRFYNYLRDYIKNNDLESLETFMEYVPLNESQKSRRSEIKQKLSEGKLLTDKTINTTSKSSTKTESQKKQMNIRKDLYENNLDKVRSDIEITLQNVSDTHIREIINERLKKIDSSDMNKEKKLDEYSSIQEIIDIYSNLNNIYTTVDDFYSEIPYYEEFLEYVRNKEPGLMTTIGEDYSLFEKTVTSFITYVKEKFPNISKDFGNKYLNKFKAHYTDICGDFKEEVRIHTLREYCKRNNDELSDYMYDSIYLKNTNIPDQIKQQCADIHKQFGVKIFVPEDTGENTKILEYVKQELQIWCDISGGKAKLPPTIDFLSAKEKYTGNVAGFCETGTNGAISLKGFDLENTLYALRHEITHSNDLMLEEEFPEGIKAEKIVKNGNGESEVIVDLDNCKYADEFRAGGIQEYHISYAYTNPKEFIAVASEGDMSKYSPEFKELLVSLGMPRWELDMPPKESVIKRESVKGDLSRSNSKHVYYSEQKTGLTRTQEGQHSESQTNPSVVSVTPTGVTSTNGLISGRFSKEPSTYTKIGNKIFEIKPDDVTKNPDKISEIKADIENLRDTEPQKAEELQIVLETFINPTKAADVKEAQIDAVVNYLNDHFDILEEYITQQTDGIGISDKKIGKFGHRIKGEWSTRDKIANYISDAVKKGKDKTLLDAYKDVRDKYACRTVFESGDYTKHPEIQKILKEGNYTKEAYRKAELRAAELQSQPAVEMLKEAMRRAIQEGKDLSVMRISNYTSEGGIPIFSETQLAEIKEYAKDLDIDVSFIRLAREEDPYTENMIVEGATTKAQPSGYTALQVNFVTKTGEIIEWQYRGKEVHKFAEAEHLPYDLRTGKHPWAQYPELEQLYKPIAELLNEKNMPKHAYDQLNKYFTDYYVHLRRLELGFESKEPRLEDYENYTTTDENGVETKHSYKFDKRLQAKNLEKLHEYAEAVKDGVITPNRSVEEYNQEVGVKPQIENAKLSSGTVYSSVLPLQSHQTVEYNNKPKKLHRTVKDENNTVESATVAISNKSKSEMPDDIADVQQREFPADLGETNVALISKMEAALKENKPQDVMKLFEQMTDKAQQNVKAVVEKFKDNGLTIENYLAACIKQPALFYQSSKTIEKNVQGLVAKFASNGLTLDSYLMACIKSPSLFVQSPTTLEKNVKELVSKYESNGLTLDNYLQACVKQPSLFYQSHETVEKNVKNLVEKFKANGLALDNYLPACLKYPQLFCLIPETVEKNVKELVAKFESNGLTLDSYLQACVKQPQLFCLSPETVEKHVKDFVAKFESNGLTLDSYMQACIKRPSLFKLLPETIEKNVKELVAKFESNGLTLDSYLQTCVKQPQLFYQSPETIEMNVNGLVEKFEKNDLSLDSYLQACVKQPSLFCQSSETIEKNVNELVSKFKDNGLTLDRYIQACVKQPQLFYQSPETLAEHINIIRFSQFNNNKKFDTEAFWAQVLKQPIDLSFSSSLLLTRDLIIPKMFEGGEIPKELKGRRLKQKLEDYLRANPNNKYVLNIKNIPGETGQIEILKEYLAKLTEDLKLPKDMFKINVEQTNAKKMPKE